ncbi:DNA polymerase delta subunit 3-like [Xenia sp. Carnegie-2017]|uniref:DNA polymerase delta subunit 3-like n=1 Tax=Xenia sp. Carnegie-2017 TaxID=2897299 RepID=UPI001F04A477|nr:DNA polymerase delta subunit 3-like [Xenia sp. Carnegie-2017]
MAADDEMYLENLKEFVFDEDKIVTYKWLSWTLSVNVNVAKEMLYAFIQQQSKEEDKESSICAVYAVGGLIKDDKDCLIQKYLLCHDIDIKDIKQCFHEITCFHVYSVQKSKPKDSNLLYMADYDLRKQNMDLPSRWSCIKLKSDVKKSIRNVEESVDGSTNCHSMKSLDCAKQVQSKTNDKQPSYAYEKGEKSSSTSSRLSTAELNSKKGDVASFFARQMANQNKESNKAMVSKYEKKDENKTKITSNSKAKDRSVISTELKNKNLSKDSAMEKKGSETTGNKSNNNEKNEKKMDSTNIDLDDKDFKGKKKAEHDKKSQKISKQQKNDEDVEDKRRKKKTKENNEKTYVQKRKRVKNFSDTSSDEDNEEYMKENSCEITPDIANPNNGSDVHQTTAIKIRRRKRVLKSKMHINDEGYMVTEKVYESETASSEEEPIKASTNIKNKDSIKKESIQPPKKKPVNKSTQSSLTSFFKRV